MVDGKNPAGTWLKEAFEEEYPDATLEWTVPNNAINDYIDRERQNAEIDADVYLGVNIDDLVRIDDTLGGRAPPGTQRRPDRQRRADPRRT